jgi:hypothetical protein
MDLWMQRAAVFLLGGALLWALSGCAHDPNHGVNMEQARAAARRVHKPPPAGVKMMPGHGG